MPATKVVVFAPGKSWRDAGDGFKTDDSKADGIWECRSAVDWQMVPRPELYSFEHFGDLPDGEPTDVTYQGAWEPRVDRVESGPRVVGDW